jgi:hypothetical protein
VTTQQTYAILLEIESSLPPVDARWAFFQDPLILEDALGFKFPVPSEYEFELLNTIIKHRFREGPRSDEVKEGEYELFMTKAPASVLSPGTRLLPGVAITMAIVIHQATASDEVCPMPRCGSDQVIAMPGGGRTW